MRPIFYSLLAVGFDRVAITLYRLNGSIEEWAHACHIWAWQASAKAGRLHERFGGGL